MREKESGGERERGNGKAAFQSVFVCWIGAVKVKAFSYWGVGIGCF